LAKSRLQQHPTALTFVSSLTTSAFLRHDYATAADRSSEVLKAKPDDSIVLDNLAFVTLKLKRQGALALMERTDQLKPNFPADSCVPTPRCSRWRRPSNCSARPCRCNPTTPLTNVRGSVHLSWQSETVPAPATKWNQIDGMGKPVAAWQALAELAGQTQRSLPVGSFYTSRTSLAAVLK
jgi:hypothetical protein